MKEEEPTTEEFTVKIGKIKEQQIIRIPKKITQLMKIEKEKTADLIVKIPEEGDINEFRVVFRGKENAN